MNYNAAVFIIVTVKNQCLCLAVRIAGRRRKLGNDGFHQVINTFTCLCTYLYGISAVQTQVMFNLVAYAWNVCRRQVDFIDYRNDG